MTSERDFPKLVKDAVSVRREDIALAKQFILKDGYFGTDGILSRWFTPLKFQTPDWIVAPSPELQDTICSIARGYSLRLALYQAIWELIASGEVAPLAVAKVWVPEIGYQIHNMRSKMQIESVKTYYVPEILRLPRAEGIATDTDIFLQGIDCTTLDPGIREAIDQALSCFRKGLYMPATAMLAAGVEGTWTECGLAVAKNLSNTKLEALVTEQLTGIGKIVLETRKALEDGNAKSLLKAAGQSVSKVLEAESWTTVLRDRRNALHWGKQKSFVADHSGTAALLMATPIHLGTLEAIRTAC